MHVKFFSLLSEASVHVVVMYNFMLVHHQLKFVFEFTSTCTWLIVI